MQLNKIEYFVETVIGTKSGVTASRNVYLESKKCKSYIHYIYISNPKLSNI